MQTFDKITVYFQGQEYQVEQDAPYSPSIAHGYTAKDALDLKRIRETSANYLQVRNRANQFQDYAKS